MKSIVKLILSNLTSALHTISSPLFLLLVSIILYINVQCQSSDDYFLAEAAPDCLQFDWDFIVKYSTVTGHPFIILLYEPNDDLHSIGQKLFHSFECKKLIDENFGLTRVRTDEIEGQELIQKHLLNNQSHILWLDPSGELMMRKSVSDLTGIEFYQISHTILKRFSQTNKNSSLIQKTMEINKLIKEFNDNKLSDEDLYNLSYLMKQMNTINNDVINAYLQTALFKNNPTSALNLTYISDFTTNLDAPTLPFLLKYKNEFERSSGTGRTEQKIKYIVEETVQMTAMLKNIDRLNEIRDFVNKESGISNKEVFIAYMYAKYFEIQQNWDEYAIYAGNFLKHASFSNDLDIIMDVAQVSVVHIKNKDFFKKLKKIFNKSNAFYSDNYNYRLVYAGIYYRLNKNKKALQIVNNAIKLAKKHNKYYHQNAIDLKNIIQKNQLLEQNLFD